MRERNHGIDRMTFRRVSKREPIAKHIIDSLHQSIISGEFKPGDKLPGQRELAQQFGASLPSVREAISVLAATGLISATPGRGTIVRGAGEAEPSFDGWLGVAQNDAEVDDFLEVRELLEIHIVRKIARNAESTDFEPILEALSRLRRARKSPAAYLDEDLAFHRLLASCSRNKVLEKLLFAIQMPMRTQISGSIASMLKRTGELSASWELHKDLVAALQAGDAKAAEKAVRMMIERARASRTPVLNSAAEGPRNPN